MQRASNKATNGHGWTGARATMPEIRSLARQIAARFQPQKVVLFGSYAVGAAGPDSDVDLLVIMPTELSSLQQAARISQAIEHHFPLDIIVRTPLQVQERVKAADLFLQEVMATGLTLYDSADER